MNFLSYQAFHQNEIPRHGKLPDKTLRENTNQRFYLSLNLFTMTG